MPGENEGGFDHGGDFVQGESPFGGEPLLQKEDAESENLEGQLITQVAKEVSGVRANRRLSESKLTDFGPLFKNLRSSRGREGQDCGELIEQRAEHSERAQRAGPEAEAGREHGGRAGPGAAPGRTRGGMEGVTVSIPE